MRFQEQAKPLVEPRLQRSRRRCENTDVLSPASADPRRKAVPPMVREQRDRVVLQLAIETGDTHLGVFGRRAHGRQTEVPKGNGRAVLGGPSRHDFAHGSHERDDLGNRGIHFQHAHQIHIILKVARASLSQRQFPPAGNRQIDLERGSEIRGSNPAASYRTCEVWPLKLPTKRFKGPSNLGHPHTMPPIFRLRRHSASNRPECSRLANATERCAGSIPVSRIS